MEERQRADGPTKFDDAKAKLAARLLQITTSEPTALVSRTYFGGRGVVACDAAVTIQTPPKPVTDNTPTPPLPWGPTQLGPALDAALDAAGAGPAKIVIITDGSESCRLDLCSVALERLPGLRNVTVDVDYVQERPRDVARLECVARAQSAAARGLELPAHSVTGTPAVRDSTCDWVGFFLWLPGFAFSLFLIAAASLAFSHAAALDRKAEEWGEKEKERREQEKKEQEKKDKEKKTESEQSANPPVATVAAQEASNKKAKLPIGWLSVLGASFLVTVGSMWWLLSTPCGWSAAWPQFVAFADGSFGSKFLPGVFVSFVGWVLLQFWGVMQARQTKRNNDFLQHLQDRADSKRQADNAIRDEKLRVELVTDIRSRKAALDKDEQELPRARPPRNFLADDEPQPVIDPPDFAGRQAKGEAIKSRIVDVVAGLSDIARLRRYANLRWTGYWRVVDELERDKLITPSDSWELKDIFRHWETYLERGTVTDDWKAKIDGFDVARINPPESVNATAR